MSRRITIVGLAALCALALSALDATGASAAETTAYTCVEATTTAEAEFKDPHCKEAGMNVGAPFGYKHVPITAKTSLYLNSVGNTTFEAEPFLALIKLQSSHIECLECTAENRGTTGAMEVSGSGGKLRFTGVTVTNLPTKCKVLSDPGEAEGVVETEPLKFQTTGTNEVKISPATGSVFTHLWVKAFTGRKCNIERTYTIEGDVNGITRGATLSVNVPLGTTFTVSGAKASLTGEYTMEAGAIGSGTHHAVALT